jgi:hypothetical protein
MAINMRWSIRQLLLLVATVGVALVLIKLRWNELYLTFTVYLLLIALSIVAAIRLQSAIRAGFTGSATFGILYLICVLKAGLPFKDFSAFVEFNRHTQMGMEFLALAFLASSLVASFVAPDRVSEVDALASTSVDSQ